MSWTTLPGGVRRKTVGNPSLDLQEQAKNEWKHSEAQNKAIGALDSRLGPLVNCGRAAEIVR
jgi:hypothetical protein